MHTAVLSNSELTLTDGTYEPAKTKQQIWLIQGVDEAGQRFRPSDWAERISGLMATFEGGRLQYSAMLYPSIINGIKCVHLDDRLQSTAPDIHQQVMEFVSSNQLNVVESL
ncbi:MAG: DUF3579 domain-containing protein [Gammaproteobacteria bacterium]|nr:DUF3579 domain-containing protein [Gammaproteobacteria bacterium]